MEQCCVLPHTGDTPTCPMNGQVLQSVGRKTVESLIKPEGKADVRPQPYYFCNAPDCDTVYVSALGDHLITKDMLTVRVGTDSQSPDNAPGCTEPGSEMSSPEVHWAWTDGARHTIEARSERTRADMANTFRFR